MPSGTVIYWFRKALRFHDNPSLLAAIQLAIDQKLNFKPIFILDPFYGKTYKVGANRWRFLHQTLTDLDTTCKKFENRLHVISGQPEAEIETLIQNWQVSHIFWEDETEPYPCERDFKIKKLCEKLKVQVSTLPGHTLWTPEKICKKNGNQTPCTYQGFLGVARKLGDPNKEVDTPETMPKLEEKFGKKFKIPKMEDLAAEFNFNLDDLGPNKFPGGETEGLKRLDKYVNMKRSEWVRKFEKPKTEPNAIKPATTVLSPHLMYGSVSCRKFYFRLKEIYATGAHAQPPVSLMGQLFWREHFITCGATILNFNKMQGNRICRQIDWDEDEEKLNAWKEARTGYPFIDAIMTQLKQEGWIHHLARHAVACFLTRGDLYQSWEKGMLYFEEMLLDADWSLNAANWQWLSASAFFHQYFRVYSPIAFGKKTDKQGEYIKKYLPQLAKFPAKYIYEPWLAPKSIQQACGCIIGQDYPKPIVDHATIHKINIQRMKKAYDAGKIAKAQAGKSDTKSDESPPKNSKPKSETEKKPAEKRKMTAKSESDKKKLKSQPKIDTLVKKMKNVKSS